MKNQFNKTLFTAFLTISFVFITGIFSVQEVAAQRYLTEIRASGEVKGIGQFANNLAEFLNLAKTINESKSAVSPIQLGKLKASGKRLKDGTTILRSNLKGLITNFKNKNQWNDELDSQFNEVLGSRKVKGFFQRNGARKILSDFDTAINAFNAQIDEIMVIAVSHERKPSSVAGISNFSQNAFAPTTTSVRKFRLKCAVLGVAIFGAELLKAPKTAENLDGFFDESCGAGATTAT